LPRLGKSAHRRDGRSSEGGDGNEVQQSKGPGAANTRAWKRVARKARARRFSHCSCVTSTRMFSENGGAMLGRPRKGHPCTAINNSGSPGRRARLMTTAPKPQRRPPMRGNEQGRADQLGHKTHQRPFLSHGGASAAVRRCSAPADAFRSTATPRSA